MKNPDKKARRSILYFAGSIILSLLLTFLLSQPAFTQSQHYALFLLFFAVCLWVTEAIPPFAVSLLIMAYLVFTMGNPVLNSEAGPIDKYVNTFSSRIIWLLLGGFFMASAMAKTGLDKTLVKFTLKISGTRPSNVLMALMITTMFGSMVMSFTATSAMVLAAMMPLLNSHPQKDQCKAFLLGISTAAACGGMGTIIASSTNAMAAGILEKDGIQIDFLTWMMYGIPVALILTAASWLVLSRLYMKDRSPISTTFANDESNKRPRTQRIIVSAVIIVTILFWVTTSIHGISVAAISAIPIVALTVTGVLSAGDIKQLPWDTLFVIAGGLSLGVALESTAILDQYTSYVRDMHLNPVVLLFLLCYVAMIFSNVMSNVATCMLLIPLGISLMPGMQREAGIAIALSASASVMFPVSTPPNIIVYSTGLLVQKDFTVGGILIGLLGPLLAVLWVLLLR